MEHRIIKKQPNTKLCFVCGIANDWGISARFFETDQNEVVALFTPCDKHQGYPGRLHGGIATAILDETIGRAILMGKGGDMWGVTVELKVKFRKPVPLNGELKVTGRVAETSKRFFEGTGEIRLSNGEIAVTAHGRYLRVPLEKISDFDDEELDWKVTPDENDPGTITI